MAKGIQDIGNGLGWLYKTLPDGATIISTERNTPDGVRTMRSNGLINAPLAADRSAIGTITVTSVAGAGSITAITIAGVNQIGANINVSSSTESVVAKQIANAINAYTPSSGDDFSAQASNDVVYVFSTPSYGGSANGLTITITATDPSIITSTTNFTNGMSQHGAYDTTSGYRFYIDADYGSEGTPGSGTATPTSLIYAEEITKYITQRGFQTGVGSLDVTVSGDSYASVDRYCSITQLISTNQGGASTDNLEYINPVNFIEGDIVFIRSVSTSQALTVIDSNNATTTSSPNIYLTDGNNFVIQRNKVLMLRYTYDSTLGGIFVEMSRSFTGGIVTLTRSQLMSLVATNGIDIAQTYYVTDVVNGILLTGTTSNSVSSSAYMIAINPDYQNTSGDFGGVWYSTMSLPTIAKLYAYNGSMYTSVTGAVGTAPDGDSTNWAIVSFSNSRYVREIDTIGYDLENNFMYYRQDKRGNKVSQSYASYVVSSVSAINIFQWGNDNCRDNVVINSLVNCVNQANTFFSNQFINESVIDDVTGATSVVSGNIYNKSTSTSNTYTQITNNTFTECSFTSNTGSLLSECNLVKSTVADNTSTIISQCYGSIYVHDNQSCTLSNITGINNTTNFNEIGGNTNVDMLDISGDIFFIKTNTNIIIQYNINIHNGYIQNNNNTIAINKASCGVSEISLSNEASIDGITWNTTGKIVRGTLNGNYGRLQNILIDTYVTVAVGNVEAVARNAKQTVGGSGFILDHFTLDNVGIYGEGLTKSIYSLSPTLSPLSTTGAYENICITPSSNNAYAFIDATVAISGTTLTVPRYAEHAALWYMYGCNGQNITSVVYASGTYGMPYKGPRKIIRMSGAGTLTVTPTAIATPPVANQIVSATGAVVMASLYDFVSLVKNGSVYTINEQAVVI